jgi:4-amino-4-deoxy-L-arabinose transferase-like glycosyltransferase
VLALALAGVALCYQLDGYALFEPDEGRNAEVAREMAASNDYVLPRLNGLPYLDKPVLFYAAGALTMELLGPTELAARLPSLAFTLLTLGVVTWFAHHLYGAAGAWIAAIAYVASPFTLTYARTVIMDSAVTLWMVVAIAAFYLGVERAVRPPGQPAVNDAEHPRPPDRPGAGAWAVWGWAALGLGVLTKGPVALAVPLLVMVPYARWRRRLAVVLDPVAMLVFLAVVLPWVFAVSRDVPDFLHYVLVVETAQRLTTGALGRSEAWWYFFPILLGAALPWTVVVASAFRRPVRGAAPDPRAVLLGLWIVVPLLFFTLSQSKRPQYILPLVPAFALAVAHLWRQVEGRLPGARIAGAVLAAFGGVLVVAAARLAEVFPASAEVAAVIPATARWLGAAAAIGGIAALALARHRAWTLCALALPVCAVPIAGMPLLRALGDDRSAAGLAAAMRPWVSDRTEIVAIETFPLSLPFYLQRPLTLVTRDGRELTSNYVPRRLDDFRRAPGSLLRPPEWWDDALTFCERPRLFVVRVDDGPARDRLAAAVPLVAASRKVLVFGPCGGEGFAARGAEPGEWYPPQFDLPPPADPRRSPLPPP